MASHPSGQDRQQSASQEERTLGRGHDLTEHPLARHLLLPEFKKPPMLPLPLTKQVFRRRTFIKTIPLLTNCPSSDSIVRCILITPSPPSLLLLLSLPTPRLHPSDSVEMSNVKLRIMATSGERGLQEHSQCICFLLCVSVSV